MRVYVTLSGSLNLPSSSVAAARISFPLVNRLLISSRGCWVRCSDMLPSTPYSSLHFTLFLLCRFSRAIRVLARLCTVWKGVQCNAMQCNAMQCNAMQCNAMQCNAMQCTAMQCNAMQCKQCNAMQCHANAMQCNATQYKAKQCNAMQC